MEKQDKRYLSVAIEVRLYEELLTLLKQKYAVTVARLADYRQQGFSGPAVRILEEKERALRKDIFCFKHRVIDFQDVPYHDN